jgi:hypothetical protein
MYREHLLNLLAHSYQADNIDHLALNDFLQTSYHPEVRFADFELFLNNPYIPDFLKLTQMEKDSLQGQAANDRDLFFFYIHRKQIAAAAFSVFQTKSITPEINTLPLNPHLMDSAQQQLPLSESKIELPAKKKKKAVPGQRFTGDIRPHCLFGQPNATLPDGLPIREEGTATKGKKLYVTVGKGVDAKEVEIQERSNARITARTIAKHVNNSQHHNIQTRMTDRVTGQESSDLFCFHKQWFERGEIVLVNAGFPIKEAGSRGSGKQLYVTMENGTDERIILANNARSRLKQKRQRQSHDSSNDAPIQPVMLHTQPTLQTLATTEAEAPLNHENIMPAFALENMPENTSPFLHPSEADVDDIEYYLKQFNEPLNSDREENHDEDFSYYFNDDRLIDDNFAGRASTAGFFAPQPDSTGNSQTYENRTSQVQRT